MKKVLILGSGLVVNPIVQYLLNKGYYVTIASRTKERGDEMINGHKNGCSIQWDVNDQETLDQMVKDHNITVSLLPWIYHLIIAKTCIRFKKNMVTSSYAKPEMKALDQEAKDAGIIILNEMGLDPGIDHMSAMRVIDHIHDKGGDVEEFYSICGALPAPEISTQNPFRYKFSWSPKGVVMAGNNDGNYMSKGEITHISTEDIFKNPLKSNFPGVGELDIYPNRDSIPYVKLYDIPEVKTIMRGTFRYKGWCEILDAIKTLNLISYDKIDMNGMSYADMIARSIKANNSENIKEKTAAFLKIDINSTAIEAIQWLGLFSDKQMNRKKDSSFEVTSDLMIDKMGLEDKERDMVAMEHTFVAAYPDGKKELIKSRMLDFGTPATDTAIARTVALPAAIAVEMILEEKINLKGVYIPNIKDIYNPVLNHLEHLGIKMIETFGLPLSENIK